MPPCNKTNINISFIANKHQLHLGICSGVGLTIETSASENLDGRQFTFINAVDNTKLSKTFSCKISAQPFLMYPYMGLYYSVYHQ